MSAREKPKATILLIDDEQIVHESVRRILEADGYRVDGAFRVAEAIDRLRWQSYDLVLTDLMMPDDSGMKAVEAVAKDHPHCGVVMFTGYATVESAVESIKLGALDYLPKPFTPDELSETIRKALDKTFKGRRDREIESTFAEAEKAIKSSLDLKEVLNLICVSVAKLLKLSGSAVVMRDSKNDKLEIVAHKGLSEEYLSKGTVSAKQSVPTALESGEIVTVNEPDFDSYLQYPEAARKEGIASMMVVPLQIQGAILGFLRLYSSEELSLSNEESEILTKFSDQAAQAIENAMAYEKIRTDIEGLRGHIPGVVPESEAK